MQDDQLSLIRSAVVNGSTDQALTSLLAAITERENAIRQLRLRQATRAKARQGHAVRRPPTGYVADRRGRWRMDSDPIVRAAITALFEDFERLGTIGKVVDHYNRQGIQLPVRDGDELRMTPPSRGRLRAILTHLAYMGTYVFGRRVSVGGRSRRQGNADEVVVAPGHHEGYVSSERWERIQRRLRQNRRAGQ